MSEENKQEIIDSKELNLKKEENTDVGMPNMNVDIQQKVEENNIIPDETLLGVYDEIMSNLRQDREEIQDVFNTFLDFVVNEGDGTSASKEAVVNLLKLRTETADKMSRIADLMTRVKLKEKDTFPRYLAASQNNTINISSSDKKELIKNITKKLEKVQKDDDE